MRHDSSASRQRHHESSGFQSKKAGSVTIAPAFLHGMTIFLAGLAAVGYLLVEADDDHSHFWMFANIVIQIGGMVGAGWYCRRVAKRLNSVPAVTPVLLVVMLFSYVWEGFERLFGENGHPFELLVMCSMKNVILALAAVGCWPRYQKMAAVSSLFIILFTLTMKPSIAVQIIVAIYVLVGVSWLSFSHWEALRARLLETQQAKRSYWRTGIAAVLIVGLLASVGMTDNQVTSALKGFMPSSGGTQHYDPFARGGVGDGDALVAATENIQSFAPIEEAPFRSSDQPSLYDVFDDTYEEPIVPKKTERAISLPMQVSKEVCKRIAKSKQANRQFSTLRQKNPKRKGHLKDLDSQAIFYVAGRVPLHLRMQVYDLYDGDQWYAEDLADPRRMQVREIKGKPWLEFVDRSKTYDIFSKPETHALKIANLDSNRIPAPPQAIGYHIDKLDRLDFIEQVQPDVIAMRRDKVPEMLPIHVISRRIDHDRIESKIDILGRLGGQSRYRVLPTISEMKQIKKLAQTWTKDDKHDWSKVETIVNRLRSEYTLDPNVIVSDPTQSPVAEFLLRTKRGPDYQFATAAAMMLRSIGMSSRVVSGFYARPDRYETRSRHTPVLTEDVHFWTEAYLGAGTWTTIEPTPGYEILKPPPTLLDRTIELAGFTLVWMQDHFVALLGVLFLAVMVYWSRFAIADAWWTWRWQAQEKSPLRSHVLATFDLVERRFRWCGIERPQGCTPGRWINSLPLSFEDRDQLRRLCQLVDWAAFSNTEQDLPSDFTKDRVENCCHEITTKWTLKEIRARFTPPAHQYSTDWHHRLWAFIQPSRQPTIEGKA